jgi:hypothetical protein
MIVNDRKAGLLRGVRRRGRTPDAPTGWLLASTDHIARVAMCLPLQTMQYWGFAPLNNAVLVQSVPLNEVNRELSWTLPRCGRFRVNGVRVLHKATLPHPWVVIFFLRGGFLTTPDSAGSMAQRDNRHILWYLICTFPQPARCAVVRCSQAPRWGQTK